VLRATVRAETALGRISDRLRNGQDRHGQRWQLQRPCEGDPLAIARNLLLLLGLPTLGLAFAISVLTTLGPVMLIELAESTSQVGLLMAGEGAVALAIPLVVGALSDRLPGSPATRRLPFIVAGAALAVAGIVLLAFAGSFALAAAAALAFFFGYYLYYPPYRALYADLLPRSLFARAQPSQAILRGAGLGIALVAGGVLLTVWEPLPFVIAGVVVLATTLALAPVVRVKNTCPNSVLPYDPVPAGRLLLRNGELRDFAAANALVEFSFAGLKTFIVLYVIEGLGHSPAVASAVIAVVAVAYVAGAPLAARLADRHGIVPVMRIAALAYGVGLVVGVFPTTLAPMVIGLPFIALAGAILMTLPQALAFTVGPRGSEGATAGLFDFSRGLGLVLGPIAVGAAIEAFSNRLEATDGYAAMWPVIGIPVLVSVFFLRRLEEPRGQAAYA
jgi:MFS family permease